MTTHAIMELEEGALNLVVGAREGQSIKVRRSLRLPLADLGRETLTGVLRNLGNDALLGATGIHVVLGERRVQHFTSTVPKMGAGDMVAFVTREALRLTGQQTAADVLLATRLLRRTGDTFQLATTAVAKSVWEPIGDAFAACSLPVLGLYSMETCLALGAESRAVGPVAVLECNGSRARFLLCDGQSPVQVRRFLLSSGENQAAALTTQLAMELPRTFDWLRETGQPVPTSLVLGLRTLLEDGAVAMLKGEELQSVIVAKSPLDTVAGQPTPTLGVALLLRQLVLGDAPSSLLAPPRLLLPMGGSRLVGLAAVAVVGFAAAWSAAIDGTAMLAARDELAQARAETDTLSAAVAAKLGQLVPAIDEGGTARLQEALAMRRPISRLLGDVSNAVEGGIVLDEIRFASADRIVVCGLASGGTRQSALAALAVFGKRLRELPYLRADGQDEITESPGQGSRFRFRLGMAWRNP